MKHALRALAARPAFTTVAVLTLAIGFGVNAAIFSMTRTILLQPLPYRDVDRLVLAGEASPRAAWPAVAPCRPITSSGASASPRSNRSPRGASSTSRSRA